MLASGGTVLTLSASHGPLPLNKDVEPHRCTRRDPGSVTVAEPRAQAARAVPGRRDRCRPAHPGVRGKAQEGPGRLDIVPFVYR
ncbi:hypothetical protein ScoT_00870 [Streptomyces albidoflavus]|uniref:Uncharacterized protein n=1 Tax=Streptomyces albidoflavus TaxID=1886 RepID=A0AA37BSP8_9ACTN|nr:hypothetical protein ScoT_00870 [Streptomyces albidoflavus]